MAAVMVGEDFCEGAGGCSRGVNWGEVVSASPTTNCVDVCSTASESAQISVPDGAP